MTGHLIDRPARLTPCHGCGRHILAAIESGLTVAADPEALPPGAEIAARLGGRDTWDIITIGLSVYLAYRDLFRIRANRGLPVVAAHECMARGRPHYQLIPPDKSAKRKAPVRAAVNQQEICPF